MTNIKNAKYRIKNEEGQYEVVHFETSMGQVQGLDEKVAEVEGLIADRYTKSQSDEMFRTVGTEIDAVEEVANGLNTRLTSVEGEVVGLQTGLANEIARATGVEADLQAQINALDVEIEKINHVGTGILAQAKEHTNVEIEKVNGVIAGLEGQLQGSNGALQGNIDALAGVVEANKVAIEGTVGALDGRVAVVEGKVATLEGNVADLAVEDARLAQEIQNIKDVIAGQGSDTLVFSTMDEFLGASLTPKVGDMVFVVDVKKAFIYKGADAAVALDLPTPPAGWVLFDEISTEIDLVDYAKKSEVEALIAVLDAKVVAETERAVEAERVLDEAIKALSAIVSANSEAIANLEGVTASQGTEIADLKANTYTRPEVDALIDEAVTAQMNYGGKVEPEGKKTGHVWIEFA